MSAENSHNSSHLTRVAHQRSIRSTARLYLPPRVFLACAATLSLNLAGCPEPVSPLSPVTSVTPNHGPTEGGTEVTVFGTGFDAQTGVLFGELAARSMQCTNSGLMCATTPAQPAGEVPIVLIDSSGLAIPTGFFFTYDSPEAPRPATLAIASITPASGPVTGGTPVTIRGGGFAAGTGVLFGDLAPSTLTTVNESLITAVTPAHAEGVVDVSVFDAEGQTDTLSGAFTYLAPEATDLYVSSISPLSGSVAGGTRVTIEGSGFVSGTAVFFGTTAALDIAVVNEGLMTAGAPPNPAGPTMVRLCTSDGRETAFADPFTYLTPEQASLYVSSISPLSGPVAGGTRLTIEGSGFVSGTAVFFGAVAALDITIVNEGLMTAQAPPNPAGQMTIRLRTSDGREAVFADPFTYFETPDDSDGDGLSDEQELAGWTIAVDFYGFGADHPLALVYIGVASDPNSPDTDGDGLTDYDEYLFGSNPEEADTDHDGLNDAEEIDRWWTSPVSVDTDGDADGPDGDLPPNPSLFDGAELKIDFENDPSHTPAIDATSPTLPDTDADARTDYEEFDHPVRSPILANLPEVEVGLEDAVDIRLNVEYAEEIGTSREYGKATTTSQTHTESSSLSHMIGAELGTKVGLQVEAKAGLFDWGTVKSTVEFSASVKTEHTFEYSTEDSVTNQEEYHQFLTESRNYTETYSAGTMSGGLRISNSGDIAYHLDNLGITVRLWDRSFDPETGGYLGEFKTLATLTPALADGVNLAPGDSTPVLQVSDDDVNPDVVKQFLAQPKTLQLETAYYDLETAQGLNFAFIEEETRALTATVIIDFGDGNRERYHIAARVNRNLDATYAGVNLYDFMMQYLEIPVETTTEPLVPGMDPPPSRRLWRVRGIPAAPDPSSKAFWVVVGDNLDFDDPSIGFEDIVLYGGDTVMLILTTDEDGDGLNAYEEELYGTSEETDDSDGDGLPDLLESRDQAQPDASIEETGWIVRVEGQPAYRIYSDPSNADADGDGLSDLEERGGCEIDGALDVDVADPTDCTQPGGTWHPFQGWGCVFCDESLEGCADIDNQADCEASGGSWTPLGTDPNRKDTDDDGLTDDIDPFPTLPAGRLHVKPDGDDTADGLSWDDALLTIGEAIAQWNLRNDDADPQNDVAEIWVAQGNYPPESLIHLPPNLAMYGAFQGHETKLGQRPSSTYGSVLDGTGDIGPAFLVSGDGTRVLLDGFLLSNWESYYEPGGAIRVSESSELTLRNMFFFGNFTQFYGAAVQVHSSARLVADNCVFANNTAYSEGGAVWADHALNLDLRNCLFQGNRTNGGIAGHQFGGAVYAGACRSLDITDCDFVGNQVHWPDAGDHDYYMRGGAVYIYGSHPDTRLENCVFTLNAAYNHDEDKVAGGALAVLLCDGEVSLVNCLFHRNFIEDVADNSDWANGCAVWIYSQTPSSSACITNCTFVDNYRNTDYAHGAQLSMHQPACYNIVNVIAAYNIDDANINADVAMTFSSEQVMNSSFVDRVCFVANNVINTGLWDDWDIRQRFPAGTLLLDAVNDPVFENWALANFHLAMDSVLVDWGTNFVDVDPGTPGYQPLPAWDLAGQPRIVDGNGDGEPTVDVGAYECQGQ